MTVPFYRHQLDESHAARMAQVLSTPHLTYGSVARRVEEQISNFFGSANVALTNSWSAGAFAVFQSLGIGPGDEVIVPAMTFVASANIPLLCGATVKLVDVDPATLLLDPEKVSEAISPKTRAILCVHLYGQMCDMLALRRIADSHNFFLIEDAAHAFEATRQNIIPAMLSDAAIFSFYATKNINCGEGGAVVTRNNALYETVCCFRQHGMSAGAADRFKNKYYQHWDVEGPGMKGSLPDILATLLEPQIDTCLARLEERDVLARRYRARLSELGIRFAQPLPDGRHAQHLFPIHVPAKVRDQVVAGLNEAGIGCTVNYRALQDLSLFKEQSVDAPIAKEWGDGTLSLPLYPGLAHADQDRVMDVLTAVTADYGEDMKPALQAAGAGGK